MKKVIFSVAIGLLLSLLLVGCGEKDEDEIMTELDKKISNMSGYKAKTTMTLDAGKQPQTYDVEVWHQAQNYYRVALKNQDKDQSQIILRNDDGVFVLTPALNKSFRFQSDWPKNSSQLYLYDSLIHDILMDPERTLEVGEDHYIFQTNTNYQNKNLNRQEIILNKKDLSPAQVKVMNTELDVLVQLDFTSFEWDAKFDEGDFDMERNMTGAQMTEETATVMDTPLQVHYPMYTPDETEFDSSQTLEAEMGERVVLQYSGKQPFTLIQEKSDATAIATLATPMDISAGEPVDLGFTIGVLTEDSLMWTYEGVDFLLASTALEAEEMMAIARSVYGTHEK